jgi:hypothetical protein
VIQLDYSHDSSGFFAQNPAAQMVLQEAAVILGSRINDSLSAITPDPAAGNSWTATFLDPSGGSSLSVANLTIPANTILVYAGGFTQGGGFIGFGGPGGYSVQGSSAWINEVETRGANRAIGIWGGAVRFSTTANWSFAGTGGATSSSQYDFLSVAEHELGHVLGIGGSSGWQADVVASNDTFIGPHAEASYGGPVPLNTAGQNGETADTHWGSSVTSLGLVPELSVNPYFPGQRREFTPLDWAGLQDIGWHPDQLAVTSQPPDKVFAGAGFNLAVTVEDPDGQVDTLFNGLVTLSLSGGPGGTTLGGMLIQSAQNGVAQFTELTLGQPGNGYTILASAAQVASATTSSVNVIPVSTTPQLVVTAEPATPIGAGSPFGLTVTVHDPFGQVDSTFQGTITLGLAGGPANASLGGVLTAPAIRGVATFSGLMLTVAGSYALNLTAPNASSTRTSPLAVIAGPNARLVVTTEPPGSVPLGGSVGFVVSAEDAFGNVATSFNESLTASLTGTVGNGFSGGGITATAVNGVADFSNFFVGTPGSGYTVRVTSSDGQLSALTTPFSVTRGSSGTGNTAPEIVGERILTAGTGKRKHFIGFVLDFSAVLDPSRASNAANYAVTQSIKRGRKTMAQSVAVTVQYNAASSAVSLLVSGRPAFAQGGRITVNASPPFGLSTAAGVYLAGKTAFLVRAGARGVHA